MAGDTLGFDRRVFLAGVAATIVPPPASAAKPAAAGEPNAAGEPKPDARAKEGAAPAAAPSTVFEARPGSLRLDAKHDTPVLGYGGAVPGPLVRVRHGEPVAVRLVNKLEGPTSITWHGVRNVNAMDGVAGLTQPPVPPGGSFDYRFTPPDSGLYWYHPHIWPAGAAQTAQGLYGVLIVDEAEPPKVDGDILVVIDDWALDAAGKIKRDGASAESAAGDPGTLITLNSKPPSTTSHKPGSRLRLRLLNVCSTRIAMVGFERMRAMVIAVDGQPSEIFQPARATIPIGPGSRVELLVDLPREAGREALLVMRGDKAPGHPLMTLKTEGTAVPAYPAVVKLPDNPLLPTRIPLQTSLRREIVLAAATPSGAARDEPAMRWTLNGASSNGLSGKPLFSVKRGGTVTLTFVNKTDDAQQMHVHGHVWRLLHDRDDGWDPFWRDSVLLAPGKTKHVAFIADNPGKWALTSGMLERQETGLATWFEVT